MDERTSSGDTVKYDQYGMRLRTGRDPKLCMEDPASTISDIDDRTPVEPVSPTTSEATAPTIPVSETDDLDVDDLDTSDLDVTGDDLDGDDDEGDEHIASFDNLDDANKHISKLNAENATKRVALKSYKEAFQNFNEDEQGQLLGLMSELGTSPESAAEKLIAIGNIILGREPDAASVSPQANTPPGEEDLDKPLTLRELQEREQKNTRERQFQAEVDQVFSDARSLGYADNTPEQRMYLGILANEADGDSAKAHEMVQSLFQQKIKEYIDGKKKQRQTATASPSQSLTTETESHNPKTWKEATAAAVARSNSIVGQ